MAIGNAEKLRRANQKIVCLKRELKFKDTEINKLNKVIDRMAEKLSKVPMYHLKSKDNTYKAENIDVVAMTIEEIKEYFMEDK